LSFINKKEFVADFSNRRKVCFASNFSYPKQEAIFSISFSEKEKIAVICFCTEDYFCQSDQ
jgi:hypothetical protein